VREGRHFPINARRINCGELPMLDNKSDDFFFEYAETPEEIRDKALSLATARLPKERNTPIICHIFLCQREIIKGL
jgi:hypothetical protein